MGGQTKYNLVGRTPGSWDTPATIVECVVAVKNHKEEAGVPLQAAAVYPGGLASSGENAESVRGRQRNS